MRPPTLEEAQHLKDVYVEACAIVAADCSEKAATAAECFRQGNEDQGRLFVTRMALQLTNLKVKLIFLQGINNLDFYKP